MHVWYLAGHLSSACCHIFSLMPMLNGSTGPWLHTLTGPCLGEVLSSFPPVPSHARWPLGAAGHLIDQSSGFLWITTTHDCHHPACIIVGVSVNVHKVGGLLWMNSFHPMKYVKSFLGSALLDPKIIIIIINPQFYSIYMEKRWQGAYLTQW